MRRALATALAAAALTGLAVPASAGWLEDECVNSTPYFPGASLCRLLPDNP